MYAHLTPLMFFSVCTYNILNENIAFEKDRSPVDSKRALIKNKQSCYQKQYITKQVVV